jgi:hypothetical protein
LVTLIIHKLLTFKEKQSMLKKLNMVIGAFFSEVGTQLIQSFMSFDVHIAEKSKELLITKEWKLKEFLRAKQFLTHVPYDLQLGKGDVEKLRFFLIEKRPFLLGLLENPNLLEHESFTNLLWAVFHLTEELTLREYLRQLPKPDYEHIEGDLKRAYSLLIIEWLSYLKHLKGEYPYLFSLAVRMNPFDKNASVVVT